MKTATSFPVLLRTLEILEQRIAPAALIGLDDQNHLINFDSNTPGTTTTVNVTGLGTGETLVGIDFRPNNGGLYGLTKDAANAGRLYLINPTTGAATLSASLSAMAGDDNPFTALSGTNFGVDFNPVADRLRVISDTRQDLRINVDNGFVTTDTDINPAGGTIAGSAYTSSFSGVTMAIGTTLYNIDVTNNALYIQNPPNNGTQVIVGTGLGVDPTGVAGFDILTTRDSAGVITNTGFAALTVGGLTGLYQIDLAGGTANPVANIGAGTGVLHGLTAPTGTPAPAAYTVASGSNHLLRFNPVTPGAVTDMGAITNLGLGESIIGFDFRPSDGQLYLVTKTLANGAQIYTVNTTTAAATLLGALSADPADTTDQFAGLNGTNFGVDFNPMANRLRIVSDAGQNLRINVDTRLVTTDTALSGVTGAETAVAYTNNFAGTAGTTLFYLDTTGDQLLVASGNPNDGVLAVRGPLGFDASNVNGFDITTGGQAYATLTPTGGAAGLYSINLTTGAATLVGPVGGSPGDTLGLALALNGSFQFNTPTATVGEGAGVATLTINRVGGSEGVNTVLVQTAAGTAGAADFTPFSQAVTFGAGVTSQNITIPITQDILIEGNESFTVTLSDPTGGAQLGTSQVSTVTITDDEPVIAPTNLIALDSANNLLVLSTTAVGVPSATLPVIGLGAGETLVGIDYRPATGGLYGITKDGGNAGRLYVINPATGQASFSVLLTADPADTGVDGTPAFASLSGASFGVDFNPVADRLRVISDTQQDLRINVDTGLVTTDGAINPAGYAIAGSAYTNSFAGATSTTLYNIDLIGDRLTTQTPPNNGTQNNIGALGVDATGAAGFDIVSTRTSGGAVTDTGFAALTVGGVTGLYTVNLTSGTVSSFGPIGSGGTTLLGLTSGTGVPAGNAYSIDAANNLVRFSTATPGVAAATTPITGLGQNENIVGFDFRPADGLAYLVTKSSADNSGRIYKFDPTLAGAAAGTATLVSALSPLAGDDNPFTTLDGASFGVDFNPVPDRLRVVSNTGQNLRINVDTGVVTTDAALNPGTPSVFAAAYTNSFPGGGTVNGMSNQTTLYVIDSNADQLLIQNPPNNGTLGVVGAGLGVDVSAVGEFDIRANGEAFAVLTVGGTAGLYSINLTSGAATLVGAVPSGPSNGFALAPNLVAQFSTGALTVGEADGNALLTINRLNGTNGVSSAIVQTNNGTAVAGQDFTAFSQVVTFAANETSKQISIPILEDNISEGTESFTVTLQDQAGNSFNAITTQTITITDNEALPSVSIGNVSQAEGNTGNSSFNFTVSLSGPSSTPITVDYTTNAGMSTAMAGSDYVAISSTLTIPAGQTSGIIQVTVTGDTVAEPNETFNVAISNPSANAVLSTSVTGVGTILNDDAATVAAKSATFTDADGDLVTIKTTKGTLAASNLIFAPAGDSGGLQLVGLNLTDAQFLNSALTITAKRSATGGDGFTNIGYLNASGNTLGAVSIAGDLGQIDANGLTSLTVQSVGKLGLSTQAGGGSLVSNIIGNLPRLTVKTDIVEASIVAANLGTVTVTGSVIGGAADHSGSLEAAGRITALTIGGRLVGGADAESGSIIAKTTGALRIHDIDGGRLFIAGNTITGGASVANNRLALALGSLTVAGGVRNSDIFVGYDRNGAPVNADVTTGAINVTGDFVASNVAVGVRAAVAGGDFGADTNSLIPGGGTVVARIASITIRGQIIGTPGDTTDRFGFVAEQIGSFRNGVSVIPVKNTAGSAPDSFRIGATQDVYVREFIV